MGDQQQRHIADHAHGLPTQFAVFHAILSRNMQWVVENQRGNLKTDAVFALITFVFDMVPGEQS